MREDVDDVYVEFHFLTREYGFTQNILHVGGTKVPPYPLLNLGK